MSSVTLSKIVGPTKKPFSKPGHDQAAAVEDEVGALFDALVDPALDEGLVLGADDRAELGLRVVGAADDALLGELLHVADELVGDLVLDHAHGQSHAAHAGAAEGGVDDAGGGALERGVGQHEAVVLGLGLGLDALAVGGGDGVDVLADARWSRRS